MEARGFKCRFCDSQNLNQNNSVRSTKTRPLRGAKNRIQGCSSATADFLLEAEKRGTLPKSEKRSFWEHILKKLEGAGREVQPFCEKESKLSGENSVRVAESTLDSAYLQNGLPRKFCESARNDESFLDSADLIK